jgi:reactive intermediate/imine deaminase
MKKFYLPVSAIFFVLSLTLSSFNAEPGPLNQSQPTGQKVNVEYLNPPERSQAPFSEAVRVGHLLILSGQLGRDPQTGKLTEGGIEAETRQALENIKRTVEKYGSSMEKVIKVTVMLADISEWAKMNSVYVTYFAKNKPARSAFGVSGLAGGARVEIECWAVAD